MSINVKLPGVEPCGQGLEAFVRSGRIVYEYEDDERSGTPVPILEGDFQDVLDVRAKPFGRWDYAVLPSATLPVHVFTIRMGATAVVWLADIGNAAVWQALEHWNSLGLFAMAACLEDGTRHFVVGEFKLPPGYERNRDFGMRLSSYAGEEFRRLMASAFARDDIPEVLSQLNVVAGIRRAQMAVLHNSHTGPAALPTSVCPQPTKQGGLLPRNWERRPSA
jgi:hypothetical protein